MLKTGLEKSWSKRKTEIEEEKQNEKKFKDRNDKVQLRLLGQSTEEELGILKKNLVYLEELGKVLLEECLEYAEEHYNSSENKGAVVIRVKQFEKDRNGNHEVLIFDSKNRETNVLLVDRDRKYNIIMNYFIDIVKNSKQTEVQRAVFVVGEGEMLQAYHGSPFKLLKNFDKISDVYFYGGPVLARKPDSDNSETNGAILNLLNDVGNGNKLHLYRNVLLPLRKLYSGLFHFYIYGSCILIEFPHSFMRSDDSLENYIVILESGHLAELLNDFITFYQEVFSFGNGRKKDEWDVKKVKEIFPSTIDLKNEECDVEEIITKLWSIIESKNEQEEILQPQLVDA